MISIFLQSIQTAIRGRSINLHTFFVNGSNFFGRTYNTGFLMNAFQGKLSNGSLSLDIDFHWFSIFDKKFRRLSIAESGSFGFLIVEVSFHGLFINIIKFHGLSFNETSLLAMPLFDIDPLGVPLSEVVLVLVSPLMKAVSMELLRWYTISRTFPQSSSSRLISNRFNWFPWIFFQLKRYPRKFIQWNRLARNFLHKLFLFFYGFPINRFSSQGRSISGKGFFFSHFLNEVFSELLLMELIFIASS